VLPWNKGLTKHDDKRLARLATMHSGPGNPRAGHAPWNKGLTKADHPSLASVAEKNTGRQVLPEARARMRQAKLGKVGPQSNRWRGATWQQGGYNHNVTDGRKNYAHRHIAERLLGRPLSRREHVHHIDRDRNNNLPSNLILLSSSAHAKLHGAIYRRECDGKVSQIEWLIRKGVRFIVLDSQPADTSVVSYCAGGWGVLETFRRSKAHRRKYPPVQLRVLTGPAVAARVA
jgi:hypothetical protein